MEISKNEIKEWMRKHHHSRRWLASKCKVSAETLANWFSKNGEIPDKHMQTISRLIIDNNIQKQNVVLSFSREEFHLLETWAYKHGSMLHDHLEQTLLRLAENEVPDLDI